MFVPWRYVFNNGLSNCLCVFTWTCHVCDTRCNKPFVWDGKPFVLFLTHWWRFRFYFTSSPSVPPKPSSYYKKALKHLIIIVLVTYRFSVLVRHQFRSFGHTDCIGQTIVSKTFGATSCIQTWRDIFHFFMILHSNNDSKQNVLLHCWPQKWQRNHICYASA